MDLQPPAFQPPESFNIADYFLDARIREGLADRRALITNDGQWTYGEVQALANRWANVLRDAGVQPEQRVLIGLHDGADYVGALFGALKIGAVVVMVNPYLRADAIAYFYGYTRAVVALVHRATADAFEEARADSATPRELIVVDEPDARRRLDDASDAFENFATHRDDAAIWLFSGGTTGHPKAVVQTHTTYAVGAETYGKRLLELTADDVTIGVPKLFFGYAMGANLFFPFSVGATSILFADRSTPEALFELVERHRPTVMINVPTMVQQMVAAPGAAERDLSSLRVSTSAGEALPEELYDRWKRTFGVELIDGIGTAEMWHIFLSNRPGAVRPGTLGQPVPGYEVRVRDEDGRDLPDGEVGYLWVKGNARAIGYWQNMEKTKRAFVGEWYVSGDMLSRDADGYFTYHGRADDMLKVSGKWLAPGEVENCLLAHPSVREVAVVGVVEADGLTRPHAYVVCDGGGAELEGELAAFVHERLESYKVPRRIAFMESLPRTHLGKVDRGRLRTADDGGDAR